MKFFVKRFFLFILVIVIIITAIPMTAVALSEREQEDIYRVDTLWKDEYNQMYIDWLLESDNFVYHLDVTEGRVLFKTSNSVINFNPIQREENYIEILTSFIGVSYEELREESKRELMAELSAELFEGFEGFLSTIELTAEQSSVVARVIHSVSSEYLGSYGIHADISLYGYNEIYEKIEKEFDVALHDLDWPDGKDKVMKTFYKFIDSNEWFERLSKVAKLCSTVKDVVDIFGEGLALVAEIESYQRADEKLIRFIKYTQANTEDPALGLACNELYIKFGLNFEWNLKLALAELAAKTAIEWSFNSIKEFCEDTLGVYAIFAKAGISAGKHLADKWFNASDIVNHMQTVYCINELSEVLVPLVREELSEREAMSQAPSTYSAKHASELLYHMKLLIILRRRGEQGYFDLKSSVYTSDIVGVLKAFDWGGFNDETIDIAMWYSELSNAMLGVENRLYMFIPPTDYLDEEMMSEGEFEIEDGVLVKYNGNGKFVSIPSGVHTIAKGAFSYNDKIRSIEFPVSVAHIKSGAVDSCPNLTSVTAVAVAMVIEVGAFSGYNDLLTMYGHDNSALQIYAENNGINFVTLKNSYNDAMDYVAMDFEIEDGVLIKYNGYGEDVYIPFGIEEIGEGAFRDCTTLRSVIFSGSVKKIGYSAFNGCSSLESISIPSNVKEIDHYAFAGCIGLKNVTLNYGLEKIGAYAFERCVNLESIVIPDSVTEVGENAFIYCESMINAVVGNGVVRISDFMFHHCESLESVTIGNSVEAIGYSAFNNCESLKKLTVPASVNIIDAYAFCDCTSLSEINFSYGLELIDAYAFSGCKALLEIDIPDSVTHIYQHAFSSCNSLEKVVIGNGVKEIDTGAFRDCMWLENVTLGNGVETIGYAAFHSCESLSSIDFPNSVTMIDSYAFAGCFELAEVSFGNSLERIKAYAFVDCSKLESLVVPDSTEVIEANAFGGCAGLKSFVIGNGVTEIGNFAFYECTSLKSVTLGNSVETIGVSAFRGCEQIVSIAFPNSLRTIESYAFAECTGLIRISLGEVIDTVKAYAFSGCYKLIEVENNSELDIKSGSKENGGVAFYANHVYRGSHGESRLVIKNDYVFYNNEGYYLMGYVSDDNVLVLPDSVCENNYYIYPYAFLNNDSVFSITIPDSVLGIGEEAFSSCGNLMRFIYCGEERDWNALPKGDGWSDGIPGNVRFHNYDDGICTECGKKEIVSDGGEASVMLGDVTYDGEVTNADVLMIFRYIYNPSEYPLDEVRGDVNCDGVITNADVLVIYRYIYNPVQYPIN